MMEDVILGVLFKPGPITRERARRAMECVGGRCLFVRDETDLSSVLYAKIRQRRPSLAEQIALFTWRPQGLPSDVVQRLCSQYPSLPALIEDISQHRLSSPAGVDEIAAVLSQDYYVE